MNIKLKICGIKQNIAEVAKLQPDYMGFIFYDESPRYFNAEEIPQLPAGVKKVGVFVDEKISKVIELTSKYALDIIQLHGNESNEYIRDLQSNLEFSGTLVWKAFSLHDKFDFSELSPYENTVDKFLFDTKGKEKGGNGYTFNWEILKDYTLNKPFILSGGIGLEEMESLKELLQTDLPIYAIDVNSRFETKPGLKNTEDLKRFKNEL
ncbi:phosphoribosylanthranilate isomerase [Aequorivita xiaoshiensis]|uniref:N-(5'-phosphoribosyl)anthranilate isomerase n=1 Tax=Aequorivita xiaoshiensis TaxID=2874476 RepID=A0A9X1U6D4_9FLAO|nr:phosphoribosylanthranilate isomerase [Aequorivita xiaoshiensis]MCG2431488.1 phosphoribosylanthranilate isomerase [Aequorivita xiaoshiensis]